MCVHMSVILYNRSNSFAAKSLCYRLDAPVIVGVAWLYDAWQYPRVSFVTIISVDIEILVKSCGVFS